MYNKQIYLLHNQHQSLLHNYVIILFYLSLKQHNNLKLNYSNQRLKSAINCIQ